MKEQHISYETAKLCKELGIDLPHTHYYVYPFRSFKATGELNKNAVPDSYNANMLQIVKTRKMQPQIAPAYTQSLLQKWLRETHQIHIMIQPIGLNYYSPVIYSMENQEGLCVKILYDGIVNDILEKLHEDVLEFGLIEALKMVKSAEEKTKNN